MSLLVYAAKSDAVARHLQQVIEEVVPKEKFKVCTSVSSLSKRLQQPMNGLKFAVVMADSDQTLADIISLQELLAQLRIILILPDRTAGAFSKAHALGPRFVTYVDSDFEDVKAVLGKMVNSPRAVAAKSRKHKLTKR